MEPRQRHAVRVLLINDQDAVLLFRGWDPAEPQTRYWFTPGGGMEPDEPAVDAAARELFEETGLLLAPEEFGEPVHLEITQFSFNGVSFQQDQEFYLVRVADWAVDTSGFDEWEIQTIDASRWWSIAELEQSDEIYYPRDLVDVMKRLGIPAC